jgi:hypothetical protein
MKSFGSANNNFDTFALLLISAIANGFAIAGSQMLASTGSKRIVIQIQ